jgi:hypothetical protein
MLREDLIEQAGRCLLCMDHGARPPPPRPGSAVPDLHCTQCQLVALLCRRFSAVLFHLLHNCVSCQLPGFCQEPFDLFGRMF